jgi:hypothetical protein
MRARASSYPAVRAGLLGLSRAKTSPGGTVPTAVHGFRICFTTGCGPGWVPLLLAAAPVGTAPASFRTQRPKADTISCGWAAETGPVPNLAQASAPKPLHEEVPALAGTLLKIVVEAVGRPFSNGTPVCSLKR